MSEPDSITARDIRDSFDLRFATARGPLIAICTGLIGPAEAEDVVHDTYLRARSRLGQLRDTGNLEAWLARIAIRLCYNRQRHLRLLRDRLPSLLSVQVHRTSDLGLRELIERLPARERTVLILRYGYGYGLDEIAALLSLRHSNVRTILTRTRQRLAAQWREVE